jgi:hypothetical protein
MGLFDRRRAGVMQIASVSAALCDASVRISNFVVQSEEQAPPNVDAFMCVADWTTPALGRSDLL